MNDTERYAVVNGWLVENVEHHTCGAGTAETGYAHEPGCGWEPLARVEDLLQRVTLAPEEARIAAAWYTGDPQEADSAAELALARRLEASS